ncbi:hypothetical protein [uncultured Ruegeria sp.]|uniref:hypothetical protein n=1 Tax=uncultured Ruegeria sp. TaxID=259304 RepID=UPI0026200E75|nr:hypothetical protein [uncultured Ruegeria sp.]
MRQIALAATLALTLANVGAAQEQRLQFKAIIKQEQADPVAAHAAMTSLAESGYVPAIDRVGYYFRNGIGSQKDLKAARQWYASAVDAGHPWSTASLARVEMEMGRGDVALELLRAGARDNQPGAERLLATAHIDRKLGAASDVKKGRTILERMAESGDQNAARDLMVRINWKRLRGPAPDTAVEQVVRAGLGGDARYAAVALVYLSSQPDRSQEAIQTRAMLAEVPGISDRVLSPELIKLAAETNPTQFWSEVEEILEDTQPENYAKAANTAFWISKNAWVRVLQKELHAFGYYQGRIDGMMTTRTIKAQNRFCRDRELWSICASGPLRGATVRTMAGAIAKEKHSGKIDNIAHPGS